MGYWDMLYINSLLPKENDKSVEKNANSENHLAVKTYDINVGVNCIKLIIKNNKENKLKYLLLFTILTDPDTSHKVMTEELLIFWRLLHSHIVYIHNAKR